MNEYMCATTHFVSAARSHLFHFCILLFAHRWFYSFLLMCLCQLTVLRLNRGRLLVIICAHRLPVSCQVGALMLSHLCC